jgi:hypothetical protein
MKLYLPVLLLLCFFSTNGQQVADSSFKYKPLKPEYPAKNGTIVYVDEAHNNFHTLGTRYYTFGEVLKNDGYRVAPIAKKFTPGSLKDVKILVIANASGENDNWQLPTPSALLPPLRSRKPPS